MSRPPFEFIGITGRNQRRILACPTDGGYPTDLGAWFILNGGSPEVGLSWGPACYQRNLMTARVMLAFLDVGVGPFGMFAGQLAVAYLASFGDNWHLHEIEMSVYFELLANLRGCPDDGPKCAFLPRGPD